jgi:D-glycero-D-manno-heptose 1,7-bisphosphate phosphatase
MTSDGARPAAFLDRDGTIIHDVSYLARPDQVRLLPGAGDAIRRLNDARVPVIVVTNQSGIARGLFTTEAYERVHKRLVELLARDGAHIDAAYMCPHHPDFTGDCECRKPGTLLFRLAAAEHDLDLARSVFIGDRWRDVEPARAFAGRGILIAGVATPQEDRERAEREGVEIVDSLADAVSHSSLARR